MLEADNWQEMLCENFTTEIVPVPDIDKCAELLQKSGYTAQEFNSAPADEIYEKLSKF